MSEEIAQINITTTPQDFYNLISSLSLYQNRPKIDDIEFILDEEAEELIVKQTDELTFVIVDSRIPFSFFSEFSYEGETESFIIPVKRVLDILNSIFINYEKLKISSKFYSDKKDAPTIKFISSKEIFQLEMEGKAEIRRDKVDDFLKVMASEVDKVASFSISPSEIIEISYSESIYVSFVIDKKKGTVYLRSYSNIAGTKYTKRITTSSIDISVDSYKSVYNLEYLKSALENQKDKLTFTFFENNVLVIEQTKPYNTKFYLFPAGEEEE